MSKQYREKWLMANNNSSFVDSRTIENIDKIYFFLEQKSILKKKYGKRAPAFSYSTIATALHMQPKQVQFACQKMAFRKEPYFQITAVAYRSSKPVKVAELVRLIKFRKSSENSDVAITPARG